MEFVIADHTTIIQDLLHKVRCLKQELKNCDGARRFKNSKSYNFAIKPTLEGDVYGIQNLVWSGVSKEITKSNRSTNIETKNFEKETCIESRLIAINEETSNEENAKGKEKILEKTCKIC